MAIQYSGSTIVNTTFLGDSRAAIASNVISQLLAAGWTNLSGSGTDQVLASGVTPQGLQVAVRVMDPGSGNCARLYLQNVSGTSVGVANYLLPGASTNYRIIATKYHLFVLPETGAPAARQFVCGGVLWIPSWLVGVIVNNSGWMQGNGQSDAATYEALTFCKALHTRLSTYNQTNLCSDVMWSASYYVGTVLNSLQVLSVPAGAALNNGAPYTWHDDTYLAAEPLLGMGVTSSSDTARIRGQLFDAMILTAPFSIGTVISYDGHDWMAITDYNEGGSGNSRGTLCVLID
jgi:hypothetical protein